MNENSIFRNPAAVALLIVGLIAVILGPILWSAGSNQLNYDQSSAAFEHALFLDNGVNLDTSTSPAMSADQTLIGWGIGVLALGALLLVAFMIVAALRRRVVVEPVKSYTEYKAG
jgi:hypothetical protein